MLTLRPLNESGEWGAMCRSEYGLGGCGQRIRLPRGGFKSYRVNTIDWNDSGEA